MAYPEKRFSTMDFPVGNKVLPYLARNEVLRDGCNDRIEQAGLGDGIQDQDKKFMLHTHFPKVYVNRRNDPNSIVTWVSNNDILLHHQAQLDSSTFTNTSFNLVQMMGEHHIEVQMRIPQFKAYKVLHRHHTTGPMQRSLTKIATTFFTCEGRNRPFNNVHLQVRDRYRLVTFSAQETASQTEESYIIKLYHAAETAAATARFNRAMECRCDFFQGYWLTGIFHNSDYFTAPEPKMLAEVEQFQEYLQWVDFYDEIEEAVVALVAIAAGEENQ